MTKLKTSPTMDNQQSSPLGTDCRLPAIKDWLTQISNVLHDINKPKTEKLNRINYFYFRFFSFLFPFFAFL